MHYRKRKKCPQVTDNRKNHNRKHEQTRTHPQLQKLMGGAPLPRITLNYNENEENKKKEEDNKAEGDEVERNTEHKEETKKKKRNQKENKTENKKEKKRNREITDYFVIDRTDNPKDKYASSMETKNKNMKYKNHMWINMGRGYLGILLNTDIWLIKTDITILNTDTPTH